MFTVHTDKRRLSQDGRHWLLSCATFFGYLTNTHRVPEGALMYLTFMIRADLGDLVQEYASWLQNTQRCKFSTIANYSTTTRQRPRPSTSLVSITTYCYANLAPDDALLQMEPNRKSGNRRRC